MFAILFVLASCLLLCYAAWQYSLAPGFKKGKKADSGYSAILILLAAGLILRIICACVYKGHETDMTSFTYWARKAFEDGVGSIYSDSGFDYPPIYMYILYVVGAVRHLFSLEGTGFYLAVKLPAILADLAAGFLVYKISSKKLPSAVSLTLAALYIFNPATITDSSLWGQVDAVYTLLLAVMIWLISEKKLELSYFVYAACILTKHQAAYYVPFIFFGLIENYVYPEFNLKKLLRSVGIGLCAIASMFIVSIPFHINLVISQYTNALGAYSYYTVNAFNLWGMLGKNWHQLTTFGTVIGYVFSAFTVAAAALVYFKSKNKSRYFFAAAILAFFSFMLSPQMHERYGFPVMLFLLLAVIESRNIHNFLLYVFVSLTQFYNTAWILFIYEKDINKYAFVPSVKVASAISFLVFLYMLYITWRLYAKNGMDAVMITPSSEKAVPAGKKSVRARSSKGAAKPARDQSFSFRRTEHSAGVTRRDLAVIAVIMAVYSCFALYDLGDMHVPETNAVLTRSAVSLNFDSQQQITNMRIFIGDVPVTAENPMLLSFRDSESQEERTRVISSAPAMQWLELGDINENAQYITLSTAGEGLNISEVSVYNGAEPLTFSNAGEEMASVLVDEPDMPSPETGVSLYAPICINMSADTQIGKLKFYNGPREFNNPGRRLRVTAFDSSGSITYSQSYSDGSVFAWAIRDINATADKVVLSTSADELYLNEIQLIDSSNNPIVPASVTGSGADLLFDEQELVPERQTFRNSTYFDEIYHARTAYEFIHHMPVYEWTHPPLGKVFISIGIMLFGMNPFGWRIVGTIFGIFMIPIIYIFAKKLLKKQWLAVITCLLFTFDFMHFAQTRISTIDVYVTFFIMLMYLFMFKYYTMSFYDTPLKKTLIPLALCGTAMGLGIACKWTGIYAAAGLAIIFFYTLFLRWREYTFALKTPSGETDGIQHKDVIESFSHNTAVTIGWCVIFFIIVPAIIYGLSYIPYLLVPDSHGLKTILDNQRSMLTYHGSTVLGSTHPYSSRWYEWIIMKRPIWYYSGTVSDGVKEGISAFGNPLVWWLGIPAFFWLIYNAIVKKDKTCVFLLIGYLAQLVPWIPIERVTFIYHYFPCVPFITLMLGYSIKLIYDDAKSKKPVLYGAFIYAGLVIVLFLMFYPVLSGQPCSTWYAQHFLKWFDSWVLL